MLNAFIGVVLIVLPLFLRLGKVKVDSRFARDMLFCEIAFIFCLLFYRGLKEVKNSYIFFGSICLLVTHSFIIQWNVLSFAVINQWLCVCCFSLVFLTLLGNAHRINTKLIFRLLVIVGIIQSLWCIVEYCNVDLYKILINTFSDRNFVRVYLDNSTVAHEIKTINVRGAMGNTNITASLIAIVFPLSFFIKNKLFKYSSIIIMLVGIILCKSLMGGGTAFFGFLLFLSYNKNFKILTLILMGALLAASSLTSSNLQTMSNGRWEVWLKSFEYFRNLDMFNLLFGQGVGFFSDHFGAMNGAVFKQVHNEFIESIYAFGLLGTLAIMGLITKVIITSKNTLASMLVLSTCVNAIGNFPFHISTTVFIFALAFAICVNGKENIVLI